MFKKLSLIVLLSVSLCAAEPLNSLAAPKPAVSADETLWIGVAAYLLGVVAPNILDSCSKKKDEKESYKVTVCKYLLTGAQTSLGIYCLIKLYLSAKGIYDYRFPSEAEKALRKAAASANKIFDAEEGLMSCFMSKATTSRNTSGIPTACEELSNAFGALAGQPALDKVVTNFKATYAYKGY